jgi:biotin-dependent carboxylase-like uncharacterized protein
MDRRSLTIANLLVGNDPNAAALELTLVGPTLEVTKPTVIGLAGADLGGVVTPPGRRLRPGRSHRVEPGMIVSFPGSAAAGGDSRRSRETRTYLALPGGIDVPLVLGSRSTCLAGHFGGFGGRALRAGDVLEATSERPPRTAVWPADELTVEPGERLLRILEGPRLGRPARRQIGRLLEAIWTVRSDSDRMGVRLDGPGLDADERGELLSHGVPWGAIQLPPSGHPIALAADHQSTGGYPVLAVIASVDLPLLGQLAPGDGVAFTLVDRADARRALLEDEERFHRRAKLLEEARHGDDAIEWTGA